MTDAEKELRDAAQAATQGQWEVAESLGYDEVYCNWHQIGPLEFRGAAPDADGRFIAAANPTAVLALLDRIEALEADNAAMAQELQTMDARRDEAVEWIGVVREELVLAGGEGGDRDVALANLRTLVKKQATLTTAAQRASAELRHTLENLDVNGAVDADTVRHAVAMLEEATRPGSMEKMP